ncbi:MAG: hypothetical protein U5L00_11390 [Desulfovermiculus sp.]|nr:hypothetical protein [Desulfovermiculus sp.]
MDNTHEANQELKQRSPQREAMDIWNSIVMDRDLYGLYHTNDDNEAQQLLERYFDKLNFDCWPFDAANKDDRDVFIQQVKSEFITEALSKWRGQKL